jgi:hypothetical protein
MASLHGATQALKGVGGLLIGFAGLAAIIALMMVMIAGGAWVTVHVYPWVARVAAFAFAADVLVLLPLAIFRPTRGISAFGLILSSFVFGLANWMFGFLTTLTLWGGFGVVVGLFLGGVGLVPVGMLAALFHGEWGALGELVLGLVLTIGAGVLGGFLGDHTGPRPAKITNVAGT